MFLARVEGSVVATKKDPSMNGRKLLLLRPQLVDEKDPTKFRPGMNTIVAVDSVGAGRSEEHTSELQSQSNLVCRLLLEKKKKIGAKSCTHSSNCRDR